MRLIEPDEYSFLDAETHTLFAKGWVRFAGVEVRWIAPPLSIVEELVEFMKELGRVKEPDAYTAACTRFGRGAFTDRQWEEARRRLPPEYKFGRGERE